jgi:hypothetical protein
MKTGQTAAAKMLVRDSHSHPAIQREIHLLRGLPKSVSSLYKHDFTRLTRLGLSPRAHRCPLRTRRPLVYRSPR